MVYEETVAVRYDAIVTMFGHLDRLFESTAQARVASEARGDDAQVKLLDNAVTALRSVLIFVRHADEHKAYFHSRAGVLGGEAMAEQGGSHIRVRVSFVKDLSQRTRAALEMLSQAGDASKGSIKEDLQASSRDLTLALSAVEFHLTEPEARSSVQVPPRALRGFLLALQQAKEHLAGDPCTLR